MQPLGWLLLLCLLIMSTASLDSSTYQPQGQNAKETNKIIYNVSVTTQNTSTNPLPIPEQNSGAADSSAETPRPADENTDNTTDSTFQSFNATAAGDTSRSTMENESVPPVNSGIDISTDGSKNEDETSSSTTTIVLVIVSIIVFIAAIIGGIFLVKRKKKPVEILPKPKEGVPKANSKSNLLSKTTSRSDITANFKRKRKSSPQQIKKEKVRGVQPENLEDHEIKLLGPLKIESGQKDGPLRHATEDVKSGSFQKNIVYDPKMNVMVEIGTEVEDLSVSKTHITVSDDNTLLVPSENKLSSKK